MTISNNRFYNVQKSAVKLSGTSGFVIKNNEIYSYRTDAGMNAGIRSQWSKNTQILNTTLHGWFYALIVVIGKNTVVDGVYFPAEFSTDHFYPTGTAILLSDTGFTESNLVFKNIYVNKAPELFRQQGLPAEQFANTHILLENVVAYNCVAASDNTRWKIDIQQAYNVILRNISIHDKDVGNVYQGILLRDCSKVTITGCNIECTQQALFIDRSSAAYSGDIAGPVDYRITNCSFWRADAAVNQGTTVVKLYTSSYVSVLDIGRVIIDSINISLASVSAASNDHAMTLDTNNASVSNVHVHIRANATLANTKFNVGLDIHNTTWARVSGVTLVADPTVVHASAYAVAVQMNACSNVLCDNVLSKFYGVILNNCTNVNLSNVVCETAFAPYISLGTNTKVVQNNVVAFT